MKGPLLTHPRHLELRDRRNAEGAGLAWRNVVVPIGRRPVTLVEDVLDIELDPPVLVQFCIKCGIKRTLSSEDAKESEK